ncbi:peptide ABC transporter substrate-binding protein [Neobacillus vireti]|uniref:peptide ABC transporter substrate-binding protein n=1 Tax=Neobacillus vireti TaxID=220686 RepID=UPI002FFFAA67
MNGKMKALSIFLIILLVTLSACTGSNDTSTKPKDNEGNSSTETGNTIVVGISNAVGSINPINTRDMAANTIASILLDPFFEADDTMEYLPKLADSMETTDNQTFTVKLNAKAKWTDGTPVTTEDVKFTFDIITNPTAQTVGTNLNYIEGLDENGRLPIGESTVKGIEIVDAQTFVIHTKKPVDPNYLKGHLANIRTLPSHILTDKDPATLHQDPFMLKPNVTNGAYTLKDFKPESIIELNANPDYYRGAPKTEKVFFKVVPSANLTAQLQTGEIHMNYPIAGPIAVQDFEKVKNMANVRTINGLPFDYASLFFNMKTISDPKVRQAIAHAINRPQIVKQLFKDQAEIVDGPYTSPHPYLDKDIPLYDYDPEKAKELLSQSGWDKNKKLRMIIPIGNQIREQASVIIVENLRAAGINVEIQKFDFPTLMQKGAAKDFDLMVFGMVYQIDPDVSHFFQTNKPLNFAGYSNTKMDELFQQGKDEADAEKRKVIYNEVQEILNKDLPMISIYSDIKLGVVSKKVKVGEPKQFGMFYNVHEWVIEK